LRSFNRVSRSQSLVELEWCRLVSLCQAPPSIAYLVTEMSRVIDNAGRSSGRPWSSRCQVVKLLKESLTCAYVMLVTADS
jgi:hypothetical protein